MPTARGTDDDDELRRTAMMKMARNVARMRATPPSKKARSLVPVDPVQSSTLPYYPGKTKPSYDDGIYRPGKTPTGVKLL